MDRLSDAQLKALLLRVDCEGFPGDLEQLWRVERVRYRETLRRIPPAGNRHTTLLDLGSSRPWLPFCQVLLGFQHIVLNTAYRESGFVADGLSVRGAPPADVRMSLFDIERDRFPHKPESFDVVLCLEVLEHLALDPMAMMAEVNRVLKPGGTFVLTTPNAVRLSNVVNMILGEHPLGWVPYNGYDSNRHNREYTPCEVDRLLRAGGLTPDEVTTFGCKRRGLQREVLRKLVAIAMLPLSRFSFRWRRDVILGVGRKTSTRIERRPGWLYFDLAERRPDCGVVIRPKNDVAPPASASPAGMRSAADR